LSVHWSITSGIDEPIRSARQAFELANLFELVCDRTGQLALPQFLGQFFITGIERDNGNEQDAQHYEGHRNVEGEGREVCALPFPVLQVQIEAQAGHKQRT